MNARRQAALQIACRWTGQQATWNALTSAAPGNVFFGWKNFLVKDHPMLTSRQTMTKTPLPVMISCQ